jgi:CubicO group peptidase (beta-lactamase class C family)
MHLPSAWRSFNPGPRLGAREWVMAVFWLAIALGTSARAAAAEPADGRRARVEAGLLPAIELAGRRAPDWRLQDRMQRYHVPGLGIAVIDGGTLDWVQAYGVVDARGTEPVTVSTLFQAASVTKLVTAAGAMRLVQQGMLEPEADVNRYLRSWQVPVWPEMGGRPVTLAGLLSHTAGMGVQGFAGYAPGTALPDLRQMLDGLAPANSPPVRLDGVPGAAYRYSGGGYLVVQQLVEDLTGKTFQDVMRREVLQPAGMQASTYALAPAGAACGHGYDGAPRAGCGNVYPETAAAWLWSTPGDLARLGLALAASLRDEPSAGLLRPAAAQAMLTPLLDGAGLGPGVHGTGSHLYFDHAGWNRGFRAYLLVYPRLGKGVAVMANGDGADALVGEIVRGVAHAYGWPDFSPERRQAIVLDNARLDARAGQYEVADLGLVLSVTRQGDHLQVATPRGSSYTFFPASDRRYFALEDGAGLEFDGDGSEPGTGLRVWDMHAVRVLDAPPAPASATP